MRFLFTCGGTAGHINPAVSIAGKLRENDPDCEVLFIGAKGMMETRLVPAEGYEIREIEITNISRERSLDGLIHNARTLKNVAVSTIEANRIIRSFRPDAVIGTGGYVCYPVLTAASALRIPTLIHESNAVPGLTTKLLSGRVDRIMVGFEDSRNAYPDPEKVIVTGTPVRGGFFDADMNAAKTLLGLSCDKPLVSSLWGSLGAAYMNSVITEMIPMLRENRPFRLIHAAGSKYFRDVCSGLLDTAPDYGSFDVDVREYIYDMPLVMSASDLVLCRAGASSLAELTVAGKPAVIVPSPNVTNHHQEKNARVLSQAGGAVVLPEEGLTAGRLFETVCSLLGDEDRLAGMRRAMLSLAVPDAADRICDTILNTIRKS